MYYVYVLYSLKDNKKYIGFTGNLKNRLKTHEDGKVESTRNRRPLVLIYYEACNNKYDALHREIYLKSAYGHRYLTNRIKNDSYFTGR